MGWRPPLLLSLSRLSVRTHRIGSALVALLIISVIPAVLAATWWHGQVATQRTAQSARTALHAGRLDEASSVLEQWLSSQPLAAEAHYLKARLAWARNDLPLVHKELTRARALGYPLEPLATLRGLLLARMNQPSEAESLLRQAVESSNKLDPDIAEALTRIYLGEFRLGLATALLNRWIEDCPHDARPYYLQTEIDIRNDASVRDIIAHCHAALERDPALDDARLRLADFLRFDHRNAEAAAEYATYLTHKPDDPLGHLGAGQNAQEMGNLAQSSRHLDRALELSNQNPVILGAKAANELQLGHLDGACRYLDMAVAADPFDYHNRYQRMLVLSRRGKHREAEVERAAMARITRDEAEFKDLSRQLKQEPRNFQLRRRAAQWLMDHNHQAESVSWAMLILQEFPTDPSMNRLLADFYRKEGSPGLANSYEIHAAPPPHRAP